MASDPAPLRPLDIDRRRRLQQLLDGGRRLAASGLIRARSGNVSVRLGDGLLITAAGARLGSLVPADVIAVERLGERPPHASSETATHAAVYAARSDVGAVVHTHSPYATAWSTLGLSLALTLEEAGYYRMGAVVPVAAHAPGGSAELATGAAQALGGAAAVLLERHGALTVGPDLDTALDVAESLEHQAQVAWLLRQTSA
jgi:ribulose-5-phosphate 4-epimerase/fuculose-1-phosphate aldolase